LGLIEPDQPEQLRLRDASEQARNSGRLAGAQVPQQTAAPKWSLAGWMLR
jgi:hypothetical protein